MRRITAASKPQCRTTFVNSRADMFTKSAHFCITTRLVSKPEYHSLTNAPSTTAAPGRKRSEASRQAILDATYDLLKTAGFHQMSIEGVAERAGVGKATIYRWWSSKGVLAVEAFMEAVAPSIAFRETGSAQTDIERQMKVLAKAYRGRTGELLKEMIGFSQCDPEMREALFVGYLQPRREAAKATLQRGIDQGAFIPNLDLEALVDALYGPLVYRMLTGYHPIDDKFIDKIAKVVFEGIARREV
jgi:AcrR family transcriptional regulator